MKMSHSALTQTMTSCESERLWTDSLDLARFTWSLATSSSKILCL